MPNNVSDLELDGLRLDVDFLVGFDFDDSTGKARTLCLIERETAKGTINPSTLVYTPTNATIYAGPCYISPIIFRRERQETVAEETARIRNYRVLLPWDAGDIHRLDLFSITQSADPNLTGRPMTVVDVIYTSDQAGRRLTVQDVDDT